MVPNRPVVLLLQIVLFVILTVPSLSIAPVIEDVFPDIVLFTMVTVPALNMAPPPPFVPAELPERVQFVSVNVEIGPAIGGPELTIAPPKTETLFETTQFVRD